MIQRLIFRDVKRLLMSMLFTPRIQKRIKMCCDWNNSSYKAMLVLRSLPFSSNVYFDKCVLTEGWIQVWLTRVFFLVECLLSFPSIRFWCFFLSRMPPQFSINTLLVSLLQGKVGRIDRIMKWNGTRNWDSIARLSI